MTVAITVSHVVAWLGTLWSVDIVHCGELEGGIIDLSLNGYGSRLNQDVEED